MKTETAIAVAMHDVTTREEVLENARTLLAFASVAHVAGHYSLRDRLIERAECCLGASVD